MDSEPECPECGEEMVVRKNKSTQERFYGCLNYPYCDGTVTLDEPHPGYPDWAKTNE